MYISIYLLYLLLNQYLPTLFTFNFKSIYSTYFFKRLWRFSRIINILPLSLFRPIKQYGGLGSVGKVVGPFLISNLVNKINICLNLGNSKDCLNIGGVGIYLNLVSDKNS